MEPLNRMATELVDEAIDFADELAIAVDATEGDAAVLDFGVDAPGGIEAGLLLAEIQTAGLATVQTRLGSVAGSPRPLVELSTDHPALALLCAGKAGWELSVDGYEGLGSGPARALVAGEDVFEHVGYREDYDFAVLAIESDELPDGTVAGAVASRTGVPESGVFLPTCALASIAGSVTAASRAAELAVYRLVELGYDPSHVLAATGSAPVAPVAESEATAMAATTDAIAYGGRVHLIVDAPFDQFDAVVSSAATDYGQPFRSIFDGVGWAFEQLTRDLFGPAELVVDVRGGKTHSVGDTHDDLLAEGFDD